MTNVSTNKVLVRKATRTVRDSMARDRQLLADIKWVAQNVLPLLPAGVSLPDYSYNYSRDTINLTIPADPNRPWRGLDGTAVLIFRLRKAFGVNVFRRNMHGYDADDYTTTFTGNGTLAGRDVYVSITLPGQKPDTCEIVIEEVIDTSPRLVKRFRTVCGPESKPIAA